jgi:hypothetical protein
MRFSFGRQVLPLSSCLLLCACAAQNYEGAKKSFSTQQRAFVAAMPAATALREIKGAAEKCAAGEGANLIQERRVAKNGFDELSIVTRDGNSAVLLAAIEISPLDTKTTRVNVIWNRWRWKHDEHLVEKWSQGFAVCSL